MQSRPQLPPNVSSLCLLPHSPEGVADYYPTRKHNLILAQSETLKHSRSWWWSREFWWNSKGLRQSKQCYFQICSDTLLFQAAIQCCRLCRVITMGTDAARAKHQTMKLYIKDLCFLNSEGYFSWLTTQKYRLTAIAVIVPRLLIPNVNVSTAWKRQTVSPKIQLPWKILGTVKGIQEVHIRILLTASAITNISHVFSTSHSYVT